MLSCRRICIYRLDREITGRYEHLIMAKRLDTALTLDGSHLYFALIADTFFYCKASSKPSEQLPVLESIVPIH